MTDTPTDLDLVREELAAFKAEFSTYKQHVDEALQRLSPLPARLDEMDGAKMCARAAAMTFNHLDTELRGKVDEAHAKVDGIVGADGGLILSAAQPLTEEAVAAVAAQVVAAVATPPAEAPAADPA